MEETLVDKLLQKDAFSAVRRFAIGVLHAASIPLGIPAMVASVAVSAVINTTVFGLEKRLQQKKLLNFYQDEIAAIQHKSPAALTLNDLHQVAAPVEQGGKGINFLGKELNDFNTNRKFRLGYSMVSSVITTAALVGLSLAIPTFVAGSLSMVIGLGLIGLGHTVVSKTVKTTGDSMFGSKAFDNTVNQRLMSIADDIKQNPVSPMEIFGLFVDANPGLQQDIQRQFGKTYSDLTVFQKKQAADLFEPQYRAISLTDEINNGNIKPSVVGFISGGQASEIIPDYQKYQALFDRPLPRISDRVFEGNPRERVVSSYAQRILTERADNTVGQSASQSLH